MEDVDLIPMWDIFQVQKEGLAFNTLHLWIFSIKHI